MAYNIYTEFAAAQDITNISGIDVTTGMWSGDTGSLAEIYTSSLQVATSGEFYYDLYDNANISESDIQFSVAYGHVSGGGSPTLTNLNTSTLPTQVIYSQYRNILLGKGVNTFSFGTPATSSNDIYVINIQRSRLRQAIDPGNWQLGLSGSKGLFTFIDDSGLGTALTGNLIVNNAYNIYSGSLSTGIVGTTVYGTVFPDYGTIVLFPAAISASVGFSGSNGASNLNAVTNLSVPFAPYTASEALVYQYQHDALARSMRLAMAASGNNGDFTARSAETITSTNYFVRIRNSEFNYSNNPTYYSGSNPQLPLAPFRIKPITYITTVGLYNNQNELLAVAKLSRPIQKSTDKEALIRVRLDY